ncbi:uncharacterized protein LOC128498250 [Spea bombifrons]|uniref:uncharacterized protein LOC128498250 n=1 Tax=Spea bombifrons TaxID=233779 RepID=UPI0023495DBF|nr:uncharacterized protein LOC128498250 [Spea bombifrons]
MLRTPCQRLYILLFHLYNSINTQSQHTASSDCLNILQAVTASTYCKQRPPQHTASSDRLHILQELTYTQLADTDHITKQSADADHLTKQPADTDHLIAQPADADHLIAQPADTDHLTTQPADADHLIAQPADTDHLTTQPADADHLIAQPADTDHLITQPAQTDHLTKQPADSDHLIAQPADTDHLTKQPADTDHLITQPADTDHLTKQPADTDRLTKQPADTDHLITQPADTDHLTKQPADTHHFITQPADTDHLTKQPADTDHLITQPADTDHLIAQPADADHLTKQPAGTHHFITQPADTDHLTKQPADTDHLITQPADTDHLIAQPADADHLTKQPAGTHHFITQPEDTDHLTKQPAGTHHFITQPADTDHLTKQLADHLTPHIICANPFHLVQRWDPSLEKLAKLYAAKCIWEHNEERGYTGENLFLMSGSGLDVELGLSDWHRERDYYNFTTSTCQEEKMCGHYTQMVWAETERVGCGEHFCEKIEGFDEPNVYFLVCNYKPPGNFRGKRPYKVGVPCTQCPMDSFCNGSLCDKGPNLEEISPSPDTMETESLNYSSSTPNVRFIQTTTERDLVSPESLLNLATEDASWDGTKSTPVMTNNSPTQRPEDAQLNQTIKYFTGTVPSRELLKASSTIASLHTPRADHTLSSLIVTRNGQVTAPLDTTDPPSSFGLTSPPSQVSPESQTTKQGTSPKPIPTYEVQLNINGEIDIASSRAPTVSPTTYPPGVVSYKPSVQELVQQVVGIGTTRWQQESSLQTVTLTPKQKPLPIATDQKQKDHKSGKEPTDSNQKPTMNIKKDKVPAEQSMNLVLYSKKYPLKTGVMPQKWGFQSDGSGKDERTLTPAISVCSMSALTPRISNSQIFPRACKHPDQTFFGKHVYRPHSYRAYVPKTPQAFCPYPCARYPSKLSLVAPLYRTSSVSHIGGKQQKWWPSYKASSKTSSKIPCKPLAYMKGVYSLYLPQTGASKDNI